jgi:tyrosine-protein phosphatase 2/3
MPPPLLSPNQIRSSTQTSTHPKSPSPSYFGFVVNAEESDPLNSNPGAHVRQNWNFPNSNAQRDVTSPRHVPVEANPAFEAFRRQSEHNHKFSLNTSLRPTQSRNNSDIASPLAKRPALEKDVGASDDKEMQDVSFFDMPRQKSPDLVDPRLSVADHTHARLSLPGNKLTTPPLNLQRATKRSDALPSSSDKEASPMVSPDLVAELLQKHKSKVLLLDLRVYQQYASSRICRALNLCIPTVVLKRPSYNVQRLAETFTLPKDQEAFSRWQECTYIIAYDANSSLTKEATIPLNVLKKFESEGWKGTSMVIKGGFARFQKMYPGLIDELPVQQADSASSSNLSISAASKDVLPVAGGCAMPSEKSAANPFFGNIRQNMDLIGGVGQMPVKKPPELSSDHLPKWLRRAASKSDEGKLVSDNFLGLEKSEQKRMQDALSTKVSYGTPRAERPGEKVQVAGIEKGSKNRYNNIFPYDHTRVRLQSVTSEDCDYVNASHVKAEYSNRRYIATQAPIPATFNDFWKVVWEQDVRVIVMLTAESEGGQVKSHVYWKAGEYGPLKLKQLSEREVSLESKKSSSKALSSSRPSMAPRRSTTANVAGEWSAKDMRPPPPKATSSAMVRHFSLSHAGHPFEPMREIAQIHYSDWPDFGAPASPTELLGLVEQVNKYVRGSGRTPSASSIIGPDDAAPQGQRPIIVHCSAGCGRTGTFCTIDSVIDMLKRQRISHDGGDDKMDVDAGDWVNRDDVDLVAKTVDEFRHQRLSMVQNLRQFVLCYESVLQWVAAQEQGQSSKKEARPGLDPRRSYHG